MAKRSQQLKSEFFMVFQINKARKCKKFYENRVQIGKRLNIQ